MATGTARPTEAEAAGPSAHLTRDDRVGLLRAMMTMRVKLRGEARCAITWFGDGSTSRGDFHEAMNWAGVQKLPVVFVLENNQYAYSTPTTEQFAVNPVERAAAYGFPGVTVDGNDAEAMFEATRVARERAVAGEGPTLLEAVTMRMHGHAAHDDMKYVPSELVEQWRAKDPIDRQVRRAAALGADVEALRAEIKAIRPMTCLCMSWDHRALDGALAAHFLTALRKRLETVSP